MGALFIESLTIAVANRPLLRNFSLNLPSGELHVLMGPNGVGKSSLAKALIGHPDYQIIGGNVHLDGLSLLGKSPDEISRAGLFLTFQSPPALPGVTLTAFLRAAIQARLPAGKLLNHSEFYGKLRRSLQRLQWDDSWANRNVNEGFSGGECKRCEMLQLLMLEPRYVIFDEIDSGLDVDSIRLMAEVIQELQHQGVGILLITHYQKLLQQIKLDHVHRMSLGCISESGGAELAQRIDCEGFTN